MTCYFYLVHHRGLCVLLRNPPFIGSRHGRLEPKVCSAVHRTASLTASAPDTLRTLGVCIPSYHFISRVILSAKIVENSTDGGYHNTK